MITTKRSKAIISEMNFYPASIILDPVGIKSSRLS